MQIAKAAVATAETDAKIAQRERGKGAQAKREGKPRDACQWNGGMCEQWWLEGYDDPLAGMVGEAL